MSRDWKKFGSGYDPNHMGKQTRPKTAEEKRREEQYSLRGCGDPDCVACNPESAARPGGRPYVPGGGTVTGRSTGGIGDYRVIEEMVRRYGGSGALRELMGREFLFTTSDEARPAKKSGPPEKYVEARKEVEDWLFKAPEQAFDDIVGNDEALGQLKDAIEAPIKHKDLYEAYGMKMPKGALLSGPPGCGKTMFARAAASEMKRLYAPDKDFEFISISGSELQSMYIGQTERYIKAIFTFAREYKAYHGYPLLVFMDEAEVLLPDRTGRVRRVAPWEESQVATFLAEMDGIFDSGAFVLLATNRPEVIDQAVLRDGRCDFKVVVRKPTQEAVEVIIRKNFNGVLMKDKLEDLVFAAVESLWDPHRIIVEAGLIHVNLEERKLEDRGARHFLLEHIVSGAMAASIPNRAKRYAFNRDKEAGKATGVIVGDVLAAVNDLFEENKRLDHSFALDEFMRGIVEESDNDKA